METPMCSDTSTAWPNIKAQEVKKEKLDKREFMVCKDVVGYSFLFLT